MDRITAPNIKIDTEIIIDSYSRKELLNTSKMANGILTLSICNLGLILLQSESFNTDIQIFIYSRRSTLIEVTSGRIFLDITV